MHAFRLDWDFSWSSSDGGELLHVLLKALLVGYKSGMLTSTLLCNDASVCRLISWYGCMLVGF